MPRQPGLPVVRDFAAHSTDPAHYAALGGDWWLAVADVVDSTGLAAGGRDRDVNFVAAAAVAALGAVLAGPDGAGAVQFGGDGAMAAVPGGRRAAVEAALAALAHWARAEIGLPLRVGLVPVGALQAEGLEVFAALHAIHGAGQGPEPGPADGHGFGLFLGSGVAAADAWVKADGRWSVAPNPGPLPGLDGLSCRWQPVAAGRGVVLCVIADPVPRGEAGLAAIARLQAAVEAVVDTGQAAPLGGGDRLVPRWPPGLRSLILEGRAQPRGQRVRRMVRALAESALLWLLHRTGRRTAAFDPAGYRRAMARQCDFRKEAGGPRLVLDLTEAEAERIEAVLAAMAAAGDIVYGTARCDATTVTCLVGDVATGRHVHFVDGAGLGFWRAARRLKAMRGAGGDPEGGGGGAA